MVAGQRGVMMQFRAIPPLIQHIDPVRVALASYAHQVRDEVEFLRKRVGLAKEAHIPPAGISTRIRDLGCDTFHGFGRASCGAVIDQDDRPAQSSAAMRRSDRNELSAAGNAAGVEHLGRTHGGVFIDVIHTTTVRANGPYGLAVAQALVNVFPSCEHDSAIVQHTGI